MEDITVTPGMIAWGKARGCKTIEETVLLFKRQYFKVLDDVATTQGEDEEGRVLQQKALQRVNELKHCWASDLNIQEDTT